nr:reverse transcriptase domain-containing protein [Tanacetum cinerariifolium]
VSLNRLPTRLNPVCRGVSVAPVSCSICLVVLEDLDHLLFGCNMVSDIARSIYLDHLLFGCNMASDIARSIFRLNQSSPTPGLSLLTHSIRTMSPEESSFFTYADFRLISMERSSNVNLDMFRWVFLRRLRVEEKKLHDWDFGAFASFIHQTPWKSLIMLLKGLIENPNFLRFLRFRASVLLHLFSLLRFCCCAIMDSAVEPIDIQIESSECVYLARKPLKSSRLAIMGPQEVTMAQNTQPKDKLDDALWGFRTAYKTPIGCTSYKLVYEKAYHLPVELEHKAYWALKYANFDLKIAGDHRKVYPYGTVELSQPDGPNFKVNGHRLKHYFGEDVPKLVVPDLQTFARDH